METQLTQSLAVSVVLFKSRSQNESIGIVITLYKQKQNNSSIAVVNAGSSSRSGTPYVPKWIVTHLEEAEEAWTVFSRSAAALDMQSSI